MWARTPQTAGVVAGQAVTGQRRLHVDALLHKAAQAGHIVVGCMRQAHPAAGLSGDHPHRFSQAQALLASACAPHKALIDLYRPRKRHASRIDHGSAPLMQPAPSRLVGAQPQAALQVRRRDVGAMHARRAKPKPQRFAGLLHERAGCNGGLVMALKAMQAVTADRQETLAPAARTAWCAVPAKLDQILPAGRLIREASFETPPTSSGTRARAVPGLEYS